MSAAREALILVPERADVHAALAEVWLARGDVASARAAAKQGLALEPGHADCRRLLSQAEIGK